jgi:hypothetical protein
MKWAAITAFAALTMAWFGLTWAQTTRPADAPRASSPEAIERWARDFNRKQLGDPVVVEKDFYVGVQRDAAGRVSTVKIATLKRSVEFNREAGENRPGMKYAAIDLAAAAPQLAAAMDLDDDGRIDHIILPEPPDQPGPTILLRVADRFERVTATGDGKSFKLISDGRTLTFDRDAREWVEPKGAQ